MWRHISSVHNGKKQFECEFCEYARAWKQRLEKEYWRSLWNWSIQEPILLLFAHKFMKERSILIIQSVTKSLATKVMWLNSNSWKEDILFIVQFAQKNHIFVHMTVKSFLIVLFAMPCFQENSTWKIIWFTKKHETPHICKNTGFSNSIWYTLNAYYLWMNFWPDYDWNYTSSVRERKVIHEKKEPFNCSFYSKRLHVSSSSSSTWW